MDRWLWKQVCDFGPSPRGGLASTAAGPGQAPITPANTTWLWNGEKWGQSSEMGPSFSTPSGGCLAWDGARLVLYESEACRTWGRNASAWVQRQSFGPVAALDPTMVGDSIRKRCILFGGQNGAGPPSSNTWALTIATIA